ncbi:hypothetical protein GCM10009122_03200 [Fulvivirga kasyanovii]
MGDLIVVVVMASERQMPHTPKNICTGLFLCEMRINRLKIPRYPEMTKSIKLETEIEML